MEQNALLRFRYPSDDILVALREAIDDLNICSPEKYAPPELLEHDAFRGSLDSVSERLAKHLRTDFAENERQCAEWNGSFDYLVTRSVLITGALDVKTRLYTTVSNSDHGDIFYNRVIEKVGPDSYLLWGTSPDSDED